MIPMLRVFSSENLRGMEGGRVESVGGCVRAKKWGPSGPRALLVCDRFASLSARGLHSSGPAPRGLLARTRAPTRDADPTIAEQIPPQRGLWAVSCRRFRTPWAIPCRCLLEHPPEPLEHARGRLELLGGDVRQGLIPALLPGRAPRLDPAPAERRQARDDDAAIR